MTTKTFRTRKARKGIVGIEAAIVLIAFVIVAAALAFVTLNMGFFTTQKSKEAMGSSLKEASSALEVDGSVLGKTSGNQLTAIAIPLKISSGKNPIDLSMTTVTIKTKDTSIVISSLNTTNKDSANSNVFDNIGNGNYAVFVEYVGDGNDKLLEVNEKWVLVIDLNHYLNGGLEPYETIVVEIKPPTGAPLTVERMVPPNLSESVIVLEG